MFCSDSVLAGISVKTAIEAGIAGGAIAASIYLMSKPNSGRIRFSYGKTGIDPDTGKPVKDKYRAYQIYKQLAQGSGRCGT